VVLSGVVHTLDGNGKPLSPGTMGSASSSSSGGAFGVGDWWLADLDEEHADTSVTGTRKLKRTRVSIWPRFYVKDDPEGGPCE
jgi:hypothetical protein